MQAQVDIGFDQLVSLAKRLPAKQWAKLKSEVDQSDKSVDLNKNLENFLLQAPTFSKKQLDNVAKTRNAINQWRKNSISRHLYSY